MESKKTTQTLEPKKRRALKPLFITMLAGLLVIGIPIIVYLSWSLSDIEPGDYSDLKIKSVDTTSVDTTSVDNGFSYIDQDKSKIVFPPYQVDEDGEVLEEENPSFVFFLDENFKVPLKTINWNVETKLSDVPEILKRNKKILEETRKAALADRIQPSTDASINDNFPHLRFLRKWVYLQNMEIWQLASQKNFTEAFSRCESQLLIGTKLQQATTVMITYLIGGMLMKDAYQNIRWLNLHPDCPDEITKNAVTLLEAQSSTLPYLKEDIKFEFTLVNNFITDLIEKMKAGAIQSGLSNSELDGIDSMWFLPNETIDEFANYMRAILELFNSKDFPEIPDIKEYVLPPVKKFGPLKIPLHLRNQKGRELLGMVLLSGSIIENPYRIDAARGLTLLKLALHSYYKENKKLPQTLAELSPKYLSKIPLDPFTGKSFIYNKDEQLLYSLGENKIDNGGAIREDSPWVSEDDHTNAHNESDVEDENPTVFLDFP